MHLHAKEMARLERAKERSRQKRKRAKEEKITTDEVAVNDEKELEISQKNLLESDSIESSKPTLTLESKPSKEYEIPGRKPYVNHSAIDTHVQPSEEANPIYVNLNETKPVEEEPNTKTSTPPYMPMQQRNSKKTSSLEKRILKKKEKEGCKQQ